MSEVDTIPEAEVRRLHAAYLKVPSAFWLEWTVEAVRELDEQRAKGIRDLLQNQQQPYSSSMAAYQQSIFGGPYFRSSMNSTANFGLVGLFGGRFW